MSVVAPTSVTTNLFGERWSKLAINCMANPIAGLSGLGTAELRVEPGPRRLAVHLGAEVIRVGRARGFEVEPIWGIAPQRFLDAVEGRGMAEVEADISRDAKSRVGGRPSLLQDVMRGRRTEIDYLNGYVVAEGKKAGVPTPVNEAIVELYRRHGVGTLRPDPKNLEPLIRLVGA
jgi:2-dehydropantoate 2-reductase